jgi:hypothetical protein
MNSSSFAEDAEVIVQEAYIYSRVAGTAMLFKDERDIFRSRLKTIGMVEVAPSSGLGSTS